MGWNSYFESKVGNLNDLLSYRTVRTVRIRDKWVGLTYYLIVLGILSYIIGYQIVYKQSYLKLSSTIGSGRLQLLRPGTEYRWGDGQPPYCINGTGSTFPLIASQYSFPSPGMYKFNENGVTTTQLPCMYFDELDAVPQSLDPNALFVLTRLTTLNEDAVPALECETSGHSYCKWNTSSTTTSYISDVEMFTLWVDHAMVSPDLGMTRTASQMGGVMLDHVGNKVNPCDVYTLFPSGCPPFIAVGVEGKRDIISLKTLLLASGISSLDQVSGTDDNLQNETHRYGGVVIVVNIDYTNHYTTTATLNTSEVSYTYRVSSVSNAEFKAQEAYQEKNVLPSPKRIVYDRHGVRIIVFFTSSIGGFDLQTLLINLTVSLGLLSVAVSIMDQIALLLCPLRHVYKQYKERQTVDFSDLRKAAAHQGKSTVSVLGEFEKRSDLIDPVPAIFEGVDHHHHHHSHHDSGGDINLTEVPLLRRSQSER